MNKRMKFVAWAVLCLTTAIIASSQTSNLHLISTISLKADHTISLTLTSDIPTAARNSFDIFLIEDSTNLLDWRPLAALLRTNRLTNALNFADGLANGAARFYRTPTNQLITAILPPEGP